MVYLGLPLEPMLILALLLVFDYFTGILKVFILKGNLRSYRAVAGMLTKGTILLLVFTLAFMAKGIGLDFKLYLEVFISVLIISEAYSIFGNVYCCITKTEVEELDAVALAIGKVRKVIEKILLVNRDNL
jgi:phage-related holin